LLGALYLAGEGIPKDVPQGLKLSELGCERGDSFGCFNSAAVYASGGGGVKEDAAKAAEYLEKACKAGDGEGCNDLAVAYEKGNGVSKDARRARALYQQACELGFQAACKKKK
jgi:TPR repeat protein